MNKQMSTKRFIAYKATNSPHYSNAIICEEAKLEGKDEIAQLRQQFQSMMWEQNEVAERKIREMKREAAAREEKLHRKLAEIHRSVESQRNSRTSHIDERARRRPKKYPHCSHHATPMRSGHRTCLRKKAIECTADRKRPHRIVGKFDVYIIQRSNRKVVPSVREILPSTSRSVRFRGDDTPLKEGKKRLTKRPKDTEM